jgi:WD40 repeat protein
MQFAPDSKNIALWFNALADNKQTVVLLDAKGTNAWQYNWVYKDGEFSSAVFGSNITFSPDGQKMLFGNMKKLWLFGTKTGVAEKTFSEISQGAVSGIHFINDNSRMVSSTREQIFIWNLQTGEMERSLFVKEKSFEDRDDKWAPAADGKHFFLIKEDHLKELDSAGKIIFQYPEIKKIEYRNNVSVSYDGQYVMSQGMPLSGFCAANKEAYTLEVFDTKTHKLVYTNNCVEGFVAFSKTKNLLVLQEKSNAAPLRFYELPTGKFLYQIQVPKTTIKYKKPIFSQNDRYLTMTEDIDNNADYTREILIDLKTKTVKTFPVIYASAIDKIDKYAMITPRGFACDEKYIVYEGWRTKNVFFYNIEQGKFDEKLTFNNPPGITMFSSINISPNGKFLMLGTYDGSIMLWDIEHKKLQGTIYPDAAKGNWAVINPQGQFDANAGAQNDMFHVSGNTVVPLNSMFEKFYTPRLLPRILEGEEFGPSTVDVKKLKKAPVVKIQFKENTRNLEVDDDDAIQTIETKFGNASVAITAECPADAVTEIRLYQNGKLVETTRNLTVEDDNKGDKVLSKTFRINLLAGTNRFRAIAFNTERTESRPVELNVVYKLEKDAATVATIVDGIQLHVVVVGINTYKNPKYNLNYAEADAQAFKLAIENGSTGIFSKVNMHYIKDDKADRAGIVAELEKVKAASKPEDVFIFYYAGHGVVNDKKEFFLVPYDVTQLYGSDEALGQKGLSATNLQQFSKDIKAQKQLYILDACQSAGALDNIVASRGAAEEKAIAQLARSTGTHWLTASGSSQFASEFSKLGHGAFTYCLLEAFKGITDNGDKKITVKELDAYLQNKVPEITQQYQGAAQYPASYGYGNDFPIIFIK